MIEATLYGLPMYRLSISAGPTASAPAPLGASSLATETVSLSPSFQWETEPEDGDYYSVNGEVQASPGRPVQPLTGQALPTKSGQTPHGAVLVGATCATEESFDPLVSVPVTDTTRSEPTFEAESWFPANPWAVNRFGDEARLTVVPAQFQGDQDGGTLRRFTQLEFQVYYTDTASFDFAAPIVWKVDSVAMGNDADFWVTTEDPSGIQRVLMAYTEDGSHWYRRDLTYSVSQGRWETQLDDLTDQLVYFVQVVDGAGNVTLTSNKGLFFEPTRYQIYLPTILRNG